ncbi:MAG: LysE family translocator [Alphaproteobacteria bacterium]|nr:LysE family translocator [Alphaproteobacteria bacterium]
MPDLWPAVGVLAVAAITPGPNNVLVFNAALGGGLGRVISTIAAIETGSLILFGLVKLGLLAILQHFPAGVLALALCGTAYLMWLGLRLMRSSSPGHMDDNDIQASGFGVLTFQLINPKAWILMGVFASATHHEDNWLLLILILICVFTICLSLWAMAGAALARLSENPTVNRAANMVMGGSLILFAGLIGAELL